MSFKSHWVQDIFWFLILITIYIHSEVDISLQLLFILKIHNFWFPNMAAVRQATLHFLSFNEKPALFAWQCFSTSVWPVVSRERWAGMLLPLAPGHYWLLPAWSPLSLLLPNAAHSANNKPENWEVLYRKDFQLGVEIISKLDAS